MKTNSLAAKRRLTGWLLSALVVWGGTSEPVKQLCTLPDQIRITCGYDAQLNCALPLRAEIITGAQAVSLGTDQTLAEARGISLTGRQEGSATLSLKLMGLLPVKRVEVEVAPERILVPGGQAVGVAIQTQGVLVVGASDLGGAIPSPARLAGLRAGDIIEAVDGERVQNAPHLSQLVENGEAVALRVLRGDASLELRVTPERDPRDDAFRLGLWVRDSTAGVGTVSFYDPESNSFAALGHAITDVDTGTLLNVQNGEITASQITGVRKGERGTPGELVSEFQSDAQLLGEIRFNCAYGIYGACQTPLTNPLYPNGVAIMSRSEVHLGKAQILSTLAGGGLQAYDCEITRLAAQNTAAARSLVVKITDADLLAQTGGIVQGMSGSPILQDDRLVGAVTHVYVNDPTTGYGVYIEWMMEQLDNAA